MKATERRELIDPPTAYVWIIGQTHKCGVTDYEAAYTIQYE